MDRRPDRPVMTMMMGRESHHHSALTRVVVVVVVVVAIVVASANATRDPKTRDETRAAGRRVVPSGTTKP